MLRRKPSNASEKEPGQVQKKKLTLQRSSSFKDFMKPKPSSPVVNPDVTLEESLHEGAVQDESGKSSGKLGKKWRNVITRTMTRKTSKMVQKALAEEGQNESGEEGSMSPMSPTDWTPDLSAGNRTSMCSISSEDTIHSPVARQLSGCGDRQSLDSGFSQRDSMDSPQYNGPFCGRALVHTDFTPSPYDIDSLKLQKGDIIQIIEKPPVGTWTGKLNNKVGSFKFIYVTVLPDEATPPRRKRCQSQGRRKSKAKTLDEILERNDLAELGSLLGMHGFQTLEDFGGLKESHLNELNITDPEQRSKILKAVEMFHDSEGESDDEDKPEEKADMPRDSGCYESTENLTNGREDTETETEPEPKSEPEVKTEPAPEVKKESESEPEPEPVKETEETDATLAVVQEQLQELNVEDES